MDLQVLQARLKFEDEFGYSPDGVWSAPGRVNLIGEHTDYNDGFVLPFAINRRTYVSAATRDDGRVRVISDQGKGTIELDLSDIAPGNIFDWSRYPLGVIWAIQQFGVRTDVRPGLDISITSDVPIGSGLSSSAAIECAVAIALNDLWDLKTGHKTLAQAGQLAENKAVGAPTGIMDQMASLFGEEDAAVFLDCESLEVTAIPLGFADAGMEILVIDTPSKHDHATGGYSARKASCDRAAELMQVGSLRELTVHDLDRMYKVMGETDNEAFHRACHVLTENVRVLDTVQALQRGDLYGVGQLMRLSHMSMRDDFEISTEEIDTAVDVALEEGALGARLTGGGFGGAAIALIPAAERERIERRIVNEFERQGFDAPTFFTVNASRGATRDLTLSPKLEVARL